MKKINYVLLSFLLIISIINCAISKQYWSYTNLAIAFVISTMFYKHAKFVIANNVVYQLFVINWFLMGGINASISQIFFDKDIFMKSNYAVNYILFIIIALIVNILYSRKRELK